MPAYDRAAYIRLFEQMYPRFFEHDYIRSIPDDHICEEMILDLKGFSPDRPALSVPEGVVFGFFGDVTEGKGNMDDLRRAVGEVDDGWVRYYNDPSRAFCAFLDGRVVSFCDVDEMGTFTLEGRTVRIGGPGCVGTVPAYRRRGIGLRMVQLATEILKERGTDYGFIHYTGVGPWYAKLGYETILRWNGRGFVD